MRRHPPSTTLFPYTTLFRSVVAAGEVLDALGGDLEDAGRELRDEPAIVGDEDERPVVGLQTLDQGVDRLQVRSEEHTSELQSRGQLVCRLLLEKKKVNEYGR